MKMKKVLLLLALGLLLAGCATIYYNETWEYKAPWPLPTRVTVFVADVTTINRICSQLTRVARATGCYDPRTATIYSPPHAGSVVHEFRHLFEGYYHGPEPGAGWLDW